MRNFTCMLICLALLLSACGASDAAEPDSVETTAQPESVRSPAPTIDVAQPDEELIRLNVANFDSASSMSEAYVERLCEELSDVTDGKLHFAFFPNGSLLDATDSLEGVADGRADICYASTLFYGGRFPISEFLCLCGNGITSARMGTDVYRQMYEEIPELQQELGQWKILALHAGPYSPLCTKGIAASTAEDFSNLRLRTTGSIATQYIRALGATPVSMTNAELLGSLQAGEIDGFVCDWHSLDALGLYESTDYCLDMPLQFPACFVMMRQETYDSLPAEIQSLIDQFPDYASAAGGFWWDACRCEGIQKMESAGVTVSAPSAEVSAWANSDAVTGSLHRWYIDYLNEAGLDGQRIYNTCMRIVSEQAAGHAADWDSPIAYADWTEHFQPD